MRCKLKMNECSDTDGFRSRLNGKRQQVASCHRMIEQMIEIYDEAAEAATRRDHLLGIRQADVDYLWQEIAKLQQGLQDTVAVKDQLEQHVSVLKSHVQQLRHAALQAGVSPDQLPTLPELRSAAAPKVRRFSGRGVPEKTPVERNFFCGLDTPKSGLRLSGSDSLHLGGWCCDAKGRAPRRVWVAVDHRKVPCSLGWERLDVVREFAPELRVEPHCGFNVELELRTGPNFLRIWAEFESGARHCLMHRTLVCAGTAASTTGQLDQAYDVWVQQFDTPTALQEREIAEAIAVMQDAPLISVLLPTYNTPERWLAEVIESVRRQSYPHWQLCIADDASPQPHVRAMLEHYAQLDARICTVFREQNGHISAATNSALEIAEGTFCALLDHDDVLPAHALYHVAVAIQSNPGVNLIYSDEDKIDEQGNRFDPYFKSDWNPELFLSHNCISHLGVYRSSVLREIGGFDETLSGSQDWDLALRFVAHVEEQGILHIPRILYHWRYLDSSTSKSIESKPYAVTAGKRAIENYLSARNDRSLVHPGTWSGSFRVQPALDFLPTVSIILLDLDAEQTRHCLESLRSLTHPAFLEFVIVDDGAALKSREWSEFRANQIHRVGGLNRENHARSYNHGARMALGEILVLLSADVRPQHEDWLYELCAQVNRQGAGVAGPWLQYADATTFSGGLILKSSCSGVLHAFRGLPQADIGHMGRAHLTQRYLAVAGQCLVTRRVVFEALGGLDADAYANHCWNIDYCLRVRLDAGRYTVWTPYARLITQDVISPPADAADSEFGRLAENWGAIVARDPYFNPNLDEHDTRFFLAWPPQTQHPSPATLLFATKS